MTPSRRLHIVASLITGLLALAGCTTPAPQGQSAALIARAEQAMGSAALKTLTITGRGSAASVGQAHAPGMAWPGLQLTALSRAMNFEEASFREEFIRSRSEPLGGGAVPLMGSGDARGVVLARETFAWNVAGIHTVAAPAALAARLHDLWTTTPQGAVKAAAKLGATAGVRREFLRRWDTLSFSLPGQFSATLLVEDTGLISRIESTVAHAVLGDLMVVTRFSDYRPQRGAQGLTGAAAAAPLLLPGRIVQEQGGFPALDLQVTAAVANETVAITVPDNVRAAAPTVSVEKVADGVWFLAGGSHHSVAIEMGAQMLLVEAPLDSARTRAVLEAANRLVPGKQVQSVINTHHHFDHAGGLRFAAATGATIYTSALARPYFEALFAPTPAPAQPAGAAPSTAPQPAWVAVDRKLVLNAGSRLLEIHELQDSIHARGLLVVWLPREQLLIQADAYTPAPPALPGAPAVPPPAVPNANHLNLVQNLDRLQIAPKRIVPLHGHIVPAAELYTLVGRKPPP